MQHSTRCLLLQLLLKDITDQVAETDLMKQAAAFVASINAKAGATSGVSLTPATPQQGAAVSLLPMRSAAPVPEAAGHAVGHAHLQRQLRDMEQRQQVAFEELKDGMASKVSAKELNEWGGSLMQQVATFVQDGLDAVQLDINKKMEDIRQEFQTLASTAWPVPQGGGQGSLRGFYFGSDGRWQAQSTWR